MGALLSLPASLLNLLLPFTNKSTPLAQDLIHTAILCGTLYYGPQLAELYHTHIQSKPLAIHAEDTLEQLSTTGTALQDGSQPPPQAPTPPDAGDEPAQPVRRVQFGNTANEPGPAAWEHDEGEAHVHLEEEAQPGPAHANGDRPPPTRANRTIGAKKAKSLARKDQRRAYHEFHRAQAEQRRQEDAAHASEREAALAAEKARRAEIEARIEAKKREERAQQKEAERAAEEEERVRREQVLEHVRRELMSGSGMVDLESVAWELGGGKDLLWAERLVKASGVLALVERERGGKAIITSSGWAVRLDADLMREAYALAVQFGNKNGGKVGLDEFGEILETVVRSKAKAVSA